MPKFRLNVYYENIATYQSLALSYADVVIILDNIISEIYDFNTKFGDCAFQTSDFSYIIEEVDE